MVLDHLIATVPDLGATHQRLLDLGFDEAWPPGPFWPAATTSGIALGGANLELIQPDAGVSASRIDTLVLSYASLEEGMNFLKELDFEGREKIESDSNLLALRGFPPEMASTPQIICYNLYPEDPPYPFFLCAYSRFLEEHLAPARFRAPRGPLTGLSLIAPDPEAVRRRFSGHLGPIELNVDPGLAAVAAIRFEDGSTLTSGDL